jgi:hypothetical protein
MTRDIAIIEPDPYNRSCWVDYLLEELEVHAEKHRSIYNYEQALIILFDKIQNHIKGGKC